MSINIPGHAAPAVGFEAPLEMLSACHHRVERQCETLRRLVAHVASHGPDDDARVAAAAVMRYFDTAARDHHADEETDLFPALVESMAGSDAVCIRELVDSLTLDHRALESRWQRLRVMLQSIAAGDPVHLDSAYVESFIRLYERHIAREEAELLPMASRLLGDDALNEIGKAMRERRGIASID
ncbi:MAG: hemerythrin domain-containing protein [Rubrivivax sp.]|nr:hemerythrin domain-containing protein [Rubrivivax sp.]